MIHPCFTKMETSNMIVFVSGGARSGKSRYAERVATLIHERNRNSRLYYLATANRSDQEMIERIEKHKTGRHESWITLEEMHHLTNGIICCRSGDILLLDCLTIWLSNVMFDSEWDVDQIERQLVSFIEVSAQNRIHLIIVSNDLNEGMDGRYESVRDYIKTLEKLHRTIISRVDQAVQVIAGIPEIWKDEL
jgi:adenosylcobinamide kinase/adenosylcobinamide-phosphate guanylyltransferase